MLLVSTKMVIALAIVFASIAGISEVMAVAGIKESKAQPNQANTDGFYLVAMGMLLLGSLAIWYIVIKVVLLGANVVKLVLFW